MGSGDTDVSDVEGAWVGVFDVAVFRVAGLPVLVAEEGSVGAFSAGGACFDLGSAPFVRGVSDDGVGLAGVMLTESAVECEDGRSRAKSGFGETARTRMAMAAAIWDVWLSTPTDSRSRKGAVFSGELRWSHGCVSWTGRDSSTSGTKIGVTMSVGSSARLTTSGGARIVGKTTGGAISLGTLPDGFAIGVSRTNGVMTDGAITGGAITSVSYR